jgi:hypothetical protein
MTTDFRALCAELVDLLDCFGSTFNIPIETSVVARARAALAEQPEDDPSQISDGSHTFAELYEHRHALTLSLMKAKPEMFWFSRRHNDGELCFGVGDWFIVGAELPTVGSISYHLPMALWESAQRSGATMLKIGRTWDGHTPEDVVERLKAWAALAEQPVGPTDEELVKHYDRAVTSAIAIRVAVRKLTMDDRDAATVVGLRAVLARWGHPTPIPVAERLPVELSDEELWAIWNPHDGPIPAVLRAAIAADRAANALPVPEAQ